MFAANGSRHNGVIVVDDFFQVANRHRRAAQVIDFIAAAKGSSIPGLSVHNHHLPLFVLLFLLVGLRLGSYVRVLRESRLIES